MYSYRTIHQLCAQSIQYIKAILKSPASYLPKARGGAVAAGRTGSSDLSHTGFFLRRSDLRGHFFIHRLSFQQGFQTAPIQRAQHIFFQVQFQLSFEKMQFYIIWLGFSLT